MHPSGPTRCSNWKPEPAFPVPEPWRTHRPVGQSPGVRNQDTSQLSNPSGAHHRGGGERDHAVLPVRTELWPAQWRNAADWYLKANQPRKQTFSFFVNIHQNDIYLPVSFWYRLCMSLTFLPFTYTSSYCSLASVFSTISSRRLGCICYWFTLQLTVSWSMCFPVLLLSSSENVTAILYVNDIEVPAWCPNVTVNICEDFGLWLVP